MEKKKERENRKGKRKKIGKGRKRMYSIGKKYPLTHAEYLSLKITPVSFGMEK